MDPRDAPNWIHGMFDPLRGLGYTPAALGAGQAALTVGSFLGQPPGSLGHATRSE